MWYLCYISDLVLNSPLLIEMGSLWDLICCKIKTPTWANRMFLLQEPILACVTETWKSSIALHVIQPVLKACFCYFPFIHQLIALKACVCYFSQFLKADVFLRYFEQSTLKRNLTYSYFFPHCFTNIYSLQGYHVIPASLKLLV